MAKGTLSQAGYNELKKSEGYKPKAYQLSGEKHCTCCLGHYGPECGEIGTIHSDAKCQELFKSDSQKFENIVNQIYDTDRGMTQNMFDAMFSFVYNCGSFKNASKLKAALSENPLDLPKISQIWQNTCITAASPKYTAGLKARRQREAKLFCGASYSSVPLSDMSASVSSSSDFSSGETFEWEDNTYSDLSAGFSDVDYAALNQTSIVARIDDDQTYQAFNIIQDTSNAVLGANEKEISTFRHEGETEDHSLIVDETVKPAITQDEHSNIVKEDTDKSEKQDTPDEDKQLEWTITVPEGAGFAI
jgi:GH24 family phage-related lysozyme (muramidase)